LPNPFLLLQLISATVPYIHTLKNSSYGESLIERLKSKGLLQDDDAMAKGSQRTTTTRQRTSSAVSPMTATVAILAIALLASIGVMQTNNATAAYTSPRNMTLKTLVLLHK
jgi:hypothetical protein